MSLEDANNYIKTFLTVKTDQNEPQYMSMLRAPKTANFVASESISYIFNRDELVSLCDNVSANSMRFYIGADPDNGEPTLLVVPCSVDDQAGRITNLISAINPVKQHPRKARTSQPRDSFNLSDDNIEP